MAPRLRARKVLRATPPSSSEEASSAESDNATSERSSEHETSKPTSEEETSHTVSGVKCLSLFMPVKWAALVVFLVPLLLLLYKATHRVDDEWLLYIAEHLEAIGWQAPANFVSPLYAAAAALHLATIEPDYIVAEYVTRSSLESYVHSLLDTWSASKPFYAIVAGARGTGKSTLLQHVLSERAGVLSASVSSYVDGDHVYAALGRAAKARFRMQGFDAVTDESILEWLRIYKRRYDDVPVFLLEIDRTEADTGIRRIAKSVKQLACDKHLAQVVMVLSDANAAFGLPEDSARQRLVWLDDASEGEANEMLDRLGAFGEIVNGTWERDTRGRRMLFDLIGMNPMQLRKAASEVSTDGIVLAKFVTKQLVMAGNAVRDLAKVNYGDRGHGDGLGFARLICEILDNGRRTGDFGVNRGGIDFLESPSIVAAYFKRNHALLYDISREQYRFYSTSHRVAAQVLLGDTARGASWCEKNADALRTRKVSDITFPSGWESRIGSLVELYEREKAEEAPNADVRRAPGGKGEGGEKPVRDEL